jgi:ribosomal protein S18 acetylase RimI-like enzyme
MEFETLRRIRDLSDNPRYHYLLTCGEQDLAAGRHERMYRIAKSGRGALLKATIDYTNMFYSLGEVSADDFQWINSFSGKGELHFEPEHREAVEKIKTSRMSDFSWVRFYHLKLQGSFAPQKEVIRLGDSDFSEIQGLIRIFYPGASFVQRMLAHPFFGIRQNGRLISTGGIIFLDDERRICQVGSFFTHPEHRGKGYCSKIISHLLAQLEEMGATDARLEVYEANEPAWKSYEKFGFKVEKMGLETLIKA